MIEQEEKSRYKSNTGYSPMAEKQRPILGKRGQKNVTSLSTTTRRVYRWTESKRNFSAETNFIGFQLVDSNSFSAKIY